MRYALFSDVHGNLEALKAVLKDIKKQKVDKKIFLGDVVGYYSSPNECAKLIKKKSDLFIMGNHDYAVMGMMNIDLFNVYARSAMEWTQKRVKNKWLDFINGFHMSYELDNFVMVHANPMVPDRWDYILSVEEADENFHHFDQQICFIAHSHRPVFIVKSGDAPSEFILRDKIRVEEGKRYIINIGSVGQPRDLNPAACYLVYDSKTRIAELRRVDYDLTKTQKKAIKAGLPEYLSERLEQGR